MGPTQQHVIRTQVLDITLPERGWAHSVQETLSGLAGGELSRKTEAIFSRLCAPDLRVSIDRVELDLGTLSLGSWKEDFLERFGPALERALAGHLPGEVPARASREASGPSTGSILELLAEWLSHGAVPWWWVPDGHRTLESLLFEAMEANPAELIRMVRRLGVESLVRRRMILQITDAGLERLVRGLEPAHAEFTIQYGRNLRQEQEETKFVEATRRDFRDASWELILEYLLVERGTRFNTKSFLRSLIHGLAQRYGIAYESLLAHLAAAIVPETQLRRPASLQSLLQEIESEDLVAGLAREAEPAVTKSSESKEAPELWVQHAQAWREQSIPAWRDLVRLWTKLPTSQRGAWWEQILVSGSPARVARQMIDLLPPVLWREVLRSILPETTRAAVIALEEALRACHSAGAGSRGPWDGVREIFWLAVFEMAADGNGGDGEWLTLLRRFGSLLGEASWAGEMWQALHAAPALRQPAALARRLQDLAVLAGRPGFPLQLAGLRAHPELAIGLLEEFATTGSIRPHGALSLLPGGPEALLIRLAEAHPAAVTGLLQRVAAQPGGLSGLAARFSEAALGALLTVVAPRAAGLALPYLALLLRHRAMLIGTPGTEAPWRRSVWLLMLEILAGPPAGGLSGAAVIEAHLDRLSRRRGLARPELATRLWRLARTESRAATRELLRLLAAVRSGALWPAAEPTSTSVESPSPALLKHSSRARLAFWRSFLRGAATADRAGDVVEARLRQFWESAANDPITIYRELLAEAPTDAGWVAAAVATGGEALVLQVVAAQSPAWRATFRDWLDFLERLPTHDWFFPFPRRGARAHLLRGLVELYAQPRSKRLSASAVMLEILARLGVARHAAKNAGALARQLGWPALARDGWPAASSETSVLAFLLLAGSARVLRAPRAGIVTALQAAAGPELRALARTKTDPGPPPPPAPKWRRATDGNVAGPWFVNNAGLVMLAPYFPQLHRVNGLLEGDCFRDAAAAQRAVLLLQSLLTMEGTAPEHALVLNKVLCGLAVETPVPAEIELLEIEKQNGDSLLRSVLQNWPGARNLSLEGLRSSFLWRKGKLERREDSWRLTIEARGYDVLLGTLPWAFSVIKPAWMLEALYVEWV